VADQRPPAPTIRDSEDFVAIHTSSSLIEAEMLAQLLENEGIATAGFSRITGAQLGGGEAMNAHVIRVPESEESRAREIIEAYLEDAESRSVDDDEDHRPATASRYPTWIKLLALLLLAPGAAALLFLLAGLAWNAVHGLLGLPGGR
jgi:hypothetical protein